MLETALPSMLILALSSGWSSGFLHEPQGLVAYARDVAEGQEGLRDIYLRRVPGGFEERLTHHGNSTLLGGDITRISFSPTGEHIAFRANRKGDGPTVNRPLWILSIPKRSHSQVPIQGEVLDHFWSPDGALLAVRSRVKSAVWLSMYKPNKGVVKRFRSNDGFWGWCGPNRLLFECAGATSALLYTTTTGGRRTDDRWCVRGSTLSVEASPDGKRIAIAPLGDVVQVVESNGNVTKSNGMLPFRSVPTWGDEPSTLFDRPLTWDPSGRKLAYIRAGVVGDPYPALPVGIRYTVGWLNTRLESRPIVNGFLPDPNLVEHRLHGWSRGSRWVLYWHFPVNNSPPETWIARLYAFDAESDKKVELFASPPGAVWFDFFETPRP